VSLAARFLESNGIATVVMGAARDIVLHCGVPRFYWSDFPLGNSAGRPFDTASQRATLAGALALFDSAEGPGAMATSPLRWSDDDAWKDDFLDVDRLSREQLAARRAEFDAQKTIARHNREGNSE
jgi:hypothetical protein